ncbi:MAG: NAD-dependent deacylase [Acidobacteriales bacterium]|nr:NAD-dependent deacylase [Terriglobales bacterium]
MPKPIPLTSDDHVFVLTGAGISAESGIPTFRGVDGLWEKYRIEELASPLAFERDPALVWRFYSWRRKVAKSCAPNAAHFALANFEESLGERFFVCTQNVDSLHEQASSVRVLHMHGKLFESRCERPSCRHAPFADDDDYTADGLPRCECGGRIRPNICWFGETPHHMDKVMQALQRCTVFVSIGTSGVVEPAASFVAFAQQGKRRAIRTVYVGPEEPANLHMFNDFYQGKATEVVPRLFSP